MLLKYGVVKGKCPSFQLFLNFFFPSFLLLFWSLPTISQLFWLLNQFFLPLTISGCWISPYVERWLAWLLHLYVLWLNCAWFISATLQKPLTSASVSDHSERSFSQNYFLRCYHHQSSTFRWYFFDPFLYS